MAAIPQSSNATRTGSTAKRFLLFILAVGKQCSVACNGLLCVTRIDSNLKTKQNKTNNHYSNRQEHSVQNKERNHVVVNGSVHSLQSSRQTRQECSTTPFPFYFSFLDEFIYISLTYRFVYISFVFVDFEVFAKDSLDNVQLEVCRSSRKENHQIDCHFVLPLRVR